MADRFLVATGNSSSTAVWSASSGGAGGASVPGVADNAIADANSNGFTLTVDAALSVVNLTYSSTTAQLVLGANLTCSGTLTLVGTAGTRFYLRSGTRGTARTVTAATVDLQYVYLEDITGAGAGSWDLSAITGLSGDCGGNTGITFTTPASNWLRGSGNRSFSTAANWANAVDGAAGSGRVPLPQDTALLDATTGSGTITQDLVRVGAVNCTGHTGTLTWTLTSAAYGSITLATGQTLTSSTGSYLSLSGRGTQTLTCNTKAWARPFTISAPGGKWVFADDCESAANRQLKHEAGELDLGATTCTFGTYYVSPLSGQTTALTFTSGTLKLNGDSADICTAQLLTTLTAGTGLLYFTGTLTANRTVNLGTHAWYNVRNGTSGAFWLAIRGSCSGNRLTVDAGRDQRFYRGETRTFASYDLTGTAVSPITLASDTTSTATIAKSGGGTVTIQYATIDYLTGSPASTFYAYNSTDGGHNSQIYFATAKTATTGLDALIKRTGIAASTSLDALLRGVKTRGLSLDALLKATGTSAASLDAMLAMLGSSTLSLDALLQATHTATVGLDAILASSDRDDVWNLIEEHIIEALQADADLGTGGELAIATWETELPEDVGVYQANLLPAVAVEVTGQYAEELIGIPDLADWTYDVTIVVTVAGGTLTQVKTRTKRYVARIIRCLLQQHRTDKQLNTLTSEMEGADPYSVRVNIASSGTVAGRVTNGSGLRGVGEIAATVTVGVCLPTT